jgi:FMN phosphatase YigB (HAD superfamily)
MNKLFKNIKTVFLDLDDTLCDTEGLTLLRLKAL